MAIIHSLTKTPSTTILNPFRDTYLKPELNSLQLWDQTSQIMLAQVVYLPDKHMQYQCHLYLNKEVVPIVPHSFANAFSLKMKSFLMALQSYTQASRHSTTTLRYHHSQTRDVSKISNEDAVKYFPYDIFLIVFSLNLMNDSFHSLPKIPLSLFKDSQGFSHSFNMLCRIMLFSMEISVPKERTPETSHTPKGMGNPKPRKALIVTTTPKHITLRSPKNPSLFC